MSEATELLAELRDIVEPPAPTGAPPFLLMANVALALLLIGLFIWQRRRRASAWRREAIQQAQAARSATPARALLDLATLLRRVMRLHGDAATVDHLNGDAWLAYLDSVFGGNWFREGEGRIFGDSLYRQDTIASIDTQTLADSLTRRLRRLDASAVAGKKRHK